MYIIKEIKKLFSEIWFNIISVLWGQKTPHNLFTSCGRFLLPLTYFRSGSLKRSLSAWGQLKEEELLPPSVMASASVSLLLESAESMAKRDWMDASSAVHAWLRDAIAFKATLLAFRIARNLRFDSSSCRFKLVMMSFILFTNELI